jgi:hypothetical protein
MLKDEIEKKSIKKTQKIPESTRVNRQTHDQGHKTRITS